MAILEWYSVMPPTDGKGCCQVVEHTETGGENCLGVPTDFERGIGGESEANKREARGKKLLRTHQLSAERQDAEGGKDAINSWTTGPISNIELSSTLPSTFLPSAPVVVAIVGGPSADIVCSDPL